MLETIYTIPVNEAFDLCAADHSHGCPFCHLHSKLENDELDLILGASMMEPDTRIQTNNLGFCDNHWNMMLERKNRLGMALMLESHLDTLIDDLSSEGLSSLLSSKGKKESERIKNLQNTCYVCSRIDNSLKHMFENAALLWETEKEFKDKLTNQPYFCLSHYKQFIDTAKNELSKKAYPDFWKSIYTLEMNYLSTLKEDVTWFTKKYDYRYADEPWKNSKDAIERSIKFLQ